MQKVFESVDFLDRRCYSEFYLSEDILMENAALGLLKEVENRGGGSVLILAGGGNNGADGIALARMLHGDFDVGLYLVGDFKSDMAKLQFKRAKAVGVKIVDSIYEADIIVDAILGSGVNRELSLDLCTLIEEVNRYDSYLIACDMPTGIMSDGEIPSVAFKSDTTVCMGAYKIALFLDEAKDFVGDVKVADLGISKDIYQSASDMFLLQRSDMRLPFRKGENSHKGDFGFLSLYCGDKEGACLMACEAATAFGVGLISLFGNKIEKIPPYIMQYEDIPQKSSALALGMGMGDLSDEEILNLVLRDIPCVLDADIFYKECIKTILEQKEDLVLTPHPKEFSSLLKILDIKNVSVEEVQKNRFALTKEFSKRFPNVVLLLKGANTIITHQNQIYINPHGNISLAKAGSGDVLTGLVGSLLAQGYTAKDASITASLAHSFGSKVYEKNNYALNPLELIESIKTL